jgi:hypothetical protein
MSGQTAFMGSTGQIAHLGDTPVYVAPAARAFEVAPAGAVSIAPPGRVVPHEAVSGIGIGVDASA